MLIRQYLYVSSYPEGDFDAHRKNKSYAKKVERNVKYVICTVLAVLGLLTHGLTLFHFSDKNSFTIH
jgi:hypothetical protein